MLPGTTISITKKTEMWVTGDPTIQVGSYTFPMEVPLTGLNKYLLRYPDQVGGINYFGDTGLVIDDVVIYIGRGKSVGLPVFVGKLYIKSATDLTVSVFVVVKGLSEKNKLTFNDVDMGVYNLAPPLLLANIMTDTTVNPLDYDFIFFPVWNEYLLKQYYGTDKLADYFPQGSVAGAGAAGQSVSARTINHWREDGTWQISYSEPNERKINNILVPFMRLEVILQKIADALDYTLINDLIGDDEELKRICIYSNKSINDLELVYKWKIRYNEHVPSKMLLTEFLKHICKNFFCGLFVNHYARTITIRPYKYVLAQAPRHDWSSRALRGIDIAQDNTIPAYVGHDEDGSDDYFRSNWVSDVPLIADGAVITDYTDWEVFPTGLIDGYYHVKRDDAVYRYDPSRTYLHEIWSKYSHLIDKVKIGGRGDDFLSKAIPMFMQSGSSKWGTGGEYAYTIPRADTPLHIKLKLGDTGNATEDIAEHTGELTTIRLMIYRGLKKYAGIPPVSNIDFPFANTTAYDPATESESYNHSLHMDGEKGLYNKWGKEWMDFFRKKKIVTHNLLLTVEDILNHQETDKVRVNGMDYFVHSMKINVNHQGLSVTECEMVSIPFSVKL